MGSKREARDKRKALEAERFEAAKAVLIAKVKTAVGPQAVKKVVVDNQPRIAPHLVREALKEPRTTVDGSRHNSQVTWCTTKSDRKDFWSWDESRDWTEEEYGEVIEPKFKEFQEMTWAAVDEFSSGEGHKMHHGQGQDSIVPEARDRWLALGLEQFDTLFRFRLGGKRRAWGFVVQAHFHMVWWDREHNIHWPAKDRAKS